MPPTLPAAAPYNKPKLLEQRVKLRSRARSDVHLMHYVYVLRSLKDSGFYIGYSVNLRKRIQEHKEGFSFATSFRGPWRLIYYEAYLNRRMRLAVNDISRADLGVDS